jgi:D-sedoheptulose 7-phosphate isomerase
VSVDRPLTKLVDASLRASIAAKVLLLERCAGDIARAAELFVACYRQGGKAIFFGNGGSAADAQHLAAELEGRFARDRPPLPALALHANGSTLTAVANDLSFREVFRRPLRAHVGPKDVAVAISVSGTSANVVAAAQLREELDFRLVALTGEGGGALARLADVTVAVPSRIVPRVQECHLLIGHILCESVETSLFSDGADDGRG